MVDIQSLNDMQADIQISSHILSFFKAGHSDDPSTQVRMVHPALNYLLDPVQVGVLASFKEIIMISTLK